MKNIGRLLSKPDLTAQDLLDALNGACFSCGTTILRRPGTMHKAYCSTACKAFAYRIRRYGLTPDAYRQMLKNQDGFCAICKTGPATEIDHNHATDKVRALLCPGCNTKLGAVEQPEWLAKAVAYLGAHS
jgi:hypothetical protein